MNKTKVLIVGKSGLLGGDLAAKYKNTFNTVAVGRAEIEFTQPATIKNTLHKHRPDVVINCAAMTNLDQCEREPELAFKVNADGPVELAKVCAQTRAKLIHISTDYVFAGRPDVPYTEDEQTQPLSVYSKSKVAGEEKVRAALENHLILRVAWLFGFKEKCFVNFVLRKAREKGRVPVIHDQVGSVTYTMDIGDGSKHLLENNCTGTYHLTNAGSCTRWEFANEIFRLRGLDTAMLQKISAAELGWIAPRPKSLILSKEKLKRDSGFSPRPWKQALEAYLQEMEHAEEGTA